MSTFLYAMLAIVPIVVLFLSFYSLFRKRAQGVPMKKAMVSHIATLLVLVVLMSALALGASAANEADQPAPPAQTEQTASTDNAQADNSKGLTMLFVALGEAIAIYGLVIALLMLFS